MIQLSKERFINEKAMVLYGDVLTAERELGSALECSMTLEDLKNIRECRLDVDYRLNLFMQFIESIEE